MRFQMKSFQKVFLLLVLPEKTAFSALSALLERKYGMFSLVASGKGSKGCKGCWAESKRRVHEKFATFGSIQKQRHI